MKQTFKQHQKNVSRKRARRRELYKLWRKQQNRDDLGIPKFEQSRLKIEKREAWRSSEFEHITAPENFSFNENALGVIKFINQLDISYQNRYKTYVVMENVTNIDHGAIVALLAIMVQFKARNIRFNGNMPRDPKSASILYQSGFFNNLAREFKDKDRYKLMNNGKNEFVTHAWKKVDAALGAEIIKTASKTIWNQERRCQGVQRSLLELMHNTNNHAAIGSIGQKHWWLYAHHDETNKVVGFAFIDFGVGVFNSLNNKPDSSIFFNWMDKIYKRFTIGSNADVFKLILDGEFHQSVTGKPYRGKGLPGIADAFRRGQLSSLRIITNNVYAAPGKEHGQGEYKLLEASFNGTYVYWELGGENDSCL